VRIAVVNNAVPFLRGGAEVLADALTERLVGAGHSVDLVRLPFNWEPVECIADAMLAASLTRIDEVDRVIALKFPAYLVPHECRVVWLLHQFRQFYDLWPSPGGAAEPNEAVDAIRSMVLRADTSALSSVQGLFCNSLVTAERLRRFNGLYAEVLHPPLANPDAFGNIATGDYIFAGGRVNSFKRQLLSVQAMAHTRSDVQLVVAGAPETKADLEALEDARDTSGCADRITLIPRFIKEEHKVELVNCALACAYCPIDEDSYGYVTLEGAQASKALITTSDSGGITDLVIDGRSGIVCAPDPRELGRAFDLLYTSPTAAKQLGVGAHDRMLELGISWENVLNRLLA
jgi:glycosyltransferase involved in cell wall biosynthesis